MRKTVFGVGKAEEWKFSGGQETIEIPQLETVHFELDLHGTYPDEINLAVDLPPNKPTNLEDNIKGDKVKFKVDVGAPSAHLLSVEFYNSEVTLSPLNPCRTVVPDALKENDNKMIIKQSIYDHTVMVVVKTVDVDYKPIRNVTLHYLFGQTAFGKNTIDVNEDSEVVFRVPEGHLVSFVPHSKFKQAPDNPSAFVARDKLIVNLVFDTTVSHIFVCFNSVILN